MHAMQENALVDEAWLAFEAKKSKGDSHGQFDWEIFQRWFKEQRLPHVPSRRLIVLDRCAFHMGCRDSMVPSQMNKVDLQQWLMQRGITWEEQGLRARLTEEVERDREKKPMVEVVAEEQGHTVLFLPVHHPELNPIELIWARVKHDCGAVFSNSTSFKEQRQPLEASLKKDITPAYGTKVYEHVQKIDEKYWQTALMRDDEIEIEDDEGPSFCRERYVAFASVLQ